MTQALTRRQRRTQQLREQRRLEALQQTGGHLEELDCRACVHWLRGGCSLSLPEAASRQGPRRAATSCSYFRWDPTITETP